MPSRKLPEPFATLQPFVDAWALGSEQERFRKLHTTTIEDLRAFYDAVLPRLREALAYLDQWTIGELPEDARTLYDLAMTFAETAHPVDLQWKDVDFPDAYPWDRFEFRTVSAGA
ncbi:MAG TPA: hypothetical protein VHA82_16825 [Ramlibacter sp.]|uniref:hypothetical protein n=1 Tax=Ramlibacter sp. TaxID=1917967 RepID=UPI002C03F857|nr:hypothetical protein [Ramlibacter sp.]HVZ45478.1 hypothetical protein [Ramlibacter sp.]